MKKTNFLEQLENVSQKAHDFIKKNVKTMVVLCTADARKKNTDIVDTLPCVCTTTRHDEAVEYGVVGVEMRNFEIVLHGIGKGEVSGDEEEFSLSDLSDAAVCFLADELSKKL